MTDEAGATRTNSVDGLGRLAQVTEGPSAFATSYAYDALDNVTSVTHPADQTHPNGETRTFAYSSMSRLTSATNPENGTVAYMYDANGNLATRTQAGVVTTYVYDLTDQLTAKKYSDYNTAWPTPWATYLYTGGWRTSVTGGPTSTQYGYDGLGRISSSTQTTNGTIYPPLQYLYDLADGLTSETYPSGRVVVTTGYDGTGRPTAVTGTLNTAQTAYVTGAHYAPHGALAQMTGGDQVTRTWTYNSRLQMTGVVAANNAGQLMSLGFTYNAAQNNGNLQQQTISRPPVAISATQPYGYDYANRLSAAGECNQASGCSFNWSQTYVYEMVGNQALLAGSSVVASALTPQTNSASAVPYDDSNQRQNSANRHTQPAGGALG